LVHLLGLMGLISKLLLAEPRVFQGLKLASSLTLSTKVHKRLDSLLALETGGFHLIHWRVHDLFVHGLEFAEF
jgi:hypothetical protein